MRFSERRVRTAIAAAAVLGLTGCAPVPVTATTTTAPSTGFGAGVVVVSDVEQPRVTDGTGSFRIVCRQSHSSHDDPLAHRGHRGMSHLHQFFGSTTTDAHSTTESLMSAGSSCNGGTANRSAYWSPAVLDHTGSEVRASWSITYYKSGYRGVPPARVQPPPTGLRMLAGEPSGTGPDTRLSWERHVSWFCQVVGGDVIGERLGEIPVCPAGSELVMSVVFPQCWDGRRLDSPDHRSHMAYPQSGGGCPSTHPVPVPEVTENVHWPVARSTLNWRLSSDPAGVTGGRTGHADWWNGWDPAVVAVWMRHCVNAGVDCHADSLGDGRRLGGS